MSNESASIQAIQLVRKVFESVHGNLGLLKFNVEELVPTNGTNGQDSKKWDIVCSFYETLRSTSPSRYKASVDLDEIDFKTMRSRLFPNLYLVGDILNIDRPSGGYSLQLCWTTGFVAGITAS